MEVRFQPKKGHPCGLTKDSMNIVDLIFGKPLKSSEERAEQIGPTEGIPIFGLDALSSAAYGPEAALSLLIPLGLLGVQYIVPISLAIITLLVIVFFHTDRRSKRTRVAAGRTRLRDLIWAHFGDCWRLRRCWQITS